MPEGLEVRPGRVVSGRRLQGAKLAALVVLWLALVGAGTVALWMYASVPGEAAQPDEDWPREASVARDGERATLVMLAHPHCPCTRASIEELAVLMTHARGELTGYVLFTAPTGVETGWEQTDLWRSAAQIPGVTVVRDDGGEDARRFGAATSGQVVVYDPDGQLLFSGGITSARGHAGDNPGRRRILELVNSGTTDRRDSPVFGCRLGGET